MKKINIAQHVIVVGPDGAPLSPLDKRHSPMSPDEFKTYIDALIDNLVATLNTPEIRSRKILFYVHGGLANYRKSIKNAEERINRMVEAGYYPILIIWRSGLMTCYREHLFKVRQGRLYYRSGLITWLYYLLADIGRAIVRIPVAFYLQTINDLKPYINRHNTDGQNADALCDVLKRRFSEAPDTNMQISVGEDQRTFWGKILRLIILGATLPIKIISGAAVDAIGTSAWNNMLRRTRTLYRGPAEFDIRKHRDDEKAVEAALDSGPTGSLSVFLDNLSVALSTRCADHEISLIGHSMGTIVLNQMIKNFPQLTYNNIVYMGAACSIKECFDAVMPYLASTSEAHFYNLCLHRIAEVQETNAYALSAQGSLLVWIDNFLSSPTTTTDRRLGAWENIMQTTHLIPRGVRPRVTMKAFGIKKDALWPQKHSEFDDFDFWEESYWKVDA